MLERSVVAVPRRAAWIAWGLFVTIAALIVPALLIPREPLKRVLVAPPVVVPCETVEPLGVCVAPHRDGALIVRMSKYSVAAIEGWRPGDHIEEVSCYEVRSGAELADALAKHEPVVKVVRDGKPIAYRLLKL